MFEVIEFLLPLLSQQALSRGYPREQHALPGISLQLLAQSVPHLGKIVLSIQNNLLMEEQKRHLDNVDIPLRSNELGDAQSRILNVRESSRAQSKPSPVSKNTESSQPRREQRIPEEMRQLRVGDARGRGGTARPSAALQGSVAASRGRGADLRGKASCVLLRVVGFRSPAVGFRSPVVGLRSDAARKTFA